MTAMSGSDPRRLVLGNHLAELNRLAVWIEGWAQDRGHSVHVTRFWAGDPLPSPGAMEKSCMDRLTGVMKVSAGSLCVVSSRRVDQFLISICAMSAVKGLAVFLPAAGVDIRYFPDNVIAANSIVARAVYAA